MVEDIRQPSATAETIPRADAPPEAPAASLAEPGTLEPSENVASLSFVQLLVESGILSAEQLSRAQDAARRERLSLGRILVRDGLVRPSDLMALSALYLGVPMVDLRSQNVDPGAVAALPEEIARRYVVLPVQRQDNRLTVAIVDPMDLNLVQDLAACTGCAIEPVVASQEDILQHIDLFYRVTENLAERTFQVKGAVEGRITAKMLQEAPPAQVVDLLLRQAIQDRASDIHIEPAEARLRVRFRIDGILHDVMNLSLEIHPSLTSRIKIMSGMNIAERRRSQDGQFTVEVQNRKVDVRVAISNTVAGEMTVLRLLDKKFTLIGLDQLGFNHQALEQHRRLLRLPYGMIIVCGPTGAGKSTTLYASILQVNRTEQNVISLEDPVEYHITDTNQMQVHPEAGVTFASQLRSTLRLDPDVILVGEIRDQETAVVATQAALTGHLVLTSLHANDSVSALLRLRDLGVAPYLIASSVAGVIAQRMVRVVCSGCQTMTLRPVAEQRAYAAEMGEQQEQFVYGSGCNMCAQTGYRGRTGVFEVLVMSDALRQLLLSDAPRHQLLEQALQDGLILMRRDGMMKVKQGITTPYEVMRVLFTLE